MEDTGWSHYHTITIVYTITKVSAGPITLSPFGDDTKLNL